MPNVSCHVCGAQFDPETNPTNCPECGGGRLVETRPITLDEFEKCLRADVDKFFANWRAHIQEERLNNKPGTPSEWPEQLDSLADWYEQILTHLESN